MITTLKTKSRKKKVKISGKLIHSLKKETKAIIDHLIKNPDLTGFEVKDPHYEERDSNSHKERHKILVVPIEIGNDKLLSLFLGSHSRNKIKFEDHLTGYVSALEGKKFPELKVRIDLDPQFKTCPKLDEEDITNLNLARAADAKIIGKDSPIWILHKIDDQMTGRDEVTNIKKRMPAGLTVEHQTNLIGPSVQLALLAGFIANSFTYYKILDLFCGAGTTTNAIINIHRASDKLNVACIDKKIKAATNTLAGYTCQTVTFKDDIMESLDSTFLNQKFDIVIADPPHSIIYDFITKHRAKISEKCRLFLLYFSHTETKKWNDFIIRILEESFKVYRVIVGGEVLAVCIPPRLLKTVPQKEKYKNGLKRAFDDYEDHMKRNYDQSVSIEPPVEKLVK